MARTRWDGSPETVIVHPAVTDWCDTLRRSDRRHPDSPAGQYICHQPQEPYQYIYSSRGTTEDSAKKLYRPQVPGWNRIDG